MYADRVKYVLYHNGIPFDMEEPLDWDNDNKRLDRNINLHGIAVNLNDGLTFVGESKLLLESILESDGPNADIRLVRLVRNPSTDLWETDYEGWVDFLTHDISDKKIKVKFNADKNVARYRAKQNAKIELENTESLSGEHIGNLPIETLYVEGRNLLLVNKLMQDSVPKCWINAQVYDKAMALQLTEIGDKDAGNPQVSSQFNGALGGRRITDSPSQGECFLTRNESGNDYTFDGNFTLRQSVQVYGRNITSFYFRVVLVHYENGFNYDVKERTTIAEWIGNSLSEFPSTIDVSHAFTLTLGQDESASIIYELGSTGSSSKEIDFNYEARDWKADQHNQVEIDGYGWFDNKETGQREDAYYEASLTVQEDSDRKSTNNKSIMLFEAFERVMRSVLDLNFKSDLMARDEMPDYIQTGDLGEVAITHGMWLRGLESGFDKFKPLSISAKNLYESINTFYPLGMNIESDHVRIEKREYFYDNYVTIDVGEVSDLNISPSAAEFYSLIDINYKTSSSSEDENGLDEPNRSTQYSSPLSTDKDLMLKSEIRADGYGLENIRRENPDVIANADLSKSHKFDDDIWIVEVVRPLTGLRKLATWETRFAEKPKNIYSPETAINLWFSPINILLRNGKWIKPGLLTVLNDNIRFTNSEGNSNLTTRLIDGKEYAQRSDVPVSDLDEAMHLAYQAKFQAPITWGEVNGYMYGKKKIYGLVSFTFKEVKYTGHIMQLDIKKGIGNFTVKLKSKAITNG